MSPYKKLEVTSHVGRDLLQSAALFKHEWLVTWEYVSNGLQYVDVGTDPIVRVTVDTRAKKITIADNGRGMSWSDLANFFVMHGENVDRKHGKPGRGYFGTGKSAAFGIADALRVTTVRDGKRSSVELHRADIERITSGAPIPVKTLEQEHPIQAPNGTLVEIENVHLKSIDQAQISKFIERHIARWPRAIVHVNSHLCEYVEPPIAKEFRFAAAEGPFATDLGGAEMLIRVSKSPMEESQQGISIVSDGVWYETTLAGCERKEMSQYIFGELNVPALADDKSPIAAFDHSRSMTLNRSNELVQKILAFIGMHVDQVRRELVDEERRRRASQEAKRLAREADEIAKIINSDFDAFRAHLIRAASRAGGGKDHLQGPSAAEGEIATLQLGDLLPAVPTEETGLVDRDEGEGGGGGEPPTPAPPLQEADEEPATERAKPIQRNPKPRPQGGFSVEFRNLGADENRAKYEREGRVILVNLEHPQLAGAVDGVGIDDIVFRRLAYEVAFSEYSIALASEMAQAGHFIDLFEPLTVTRETLNRVARAAAPLYRSSAISK